MAENSWVADSKSSNWKKDWRVVRDWNKGCPWICSVQTLLKQDLPERRAHCPLGLERWRRVEEEKRALVERLRGLTRELGEGCTFCHVNIILESTTFKKYLFIWLLPAPRSLITEHPPLPREEPIASDCQDVALAAARVWLAETTCLFYDTAA